MAAFGFSIGDFLAILQLAKETRKRFIDAPSQFKAISDDVKCLSNVLRDIEDIEPEKSLSDQQKQTLNDTSQHCRDILKDLNKILESFQDLTPNEPRTHKWKQKFQQVVKRLEWDQAEIDAFRPRLAGITAAFGLLLNGIQIKKLEAGKEQWDITQRGVTQLVQHEEDKRRQEVLHWLSPTNHANKQADFISHVQQGTGNWLLKDDKFKRWINQDCSTVPGQQTLFCPGLPGAGKTFLTSIVIEELQDRASKCGVGIAFCYFNFREKTTQDEILAMMLHQLVEQNPNIFPVSDRLYKENKTGTTRPTALSLLSTLESAVRAFPRVFIVLDALDESQLPAGSLNRLLAEIFTLQRMHNVGMFATSRDIMSISEMFQESLHLRIYADVEDVGKFLRGQMEALPRIVQKERTYRKKSLQQFQRQRTECSFLLARLQIESLQGRASAKEIRECLKVLPTELDDAYSEAIYRIESEKRWERQKAFNVISWVSFAARPLTTLELRHALAIEDDQPHIDEENLPDIEDLVSVCAGLVTVDEQSDVVRLVHYTAQEYFDRHRMRHFPDAHREIGAKCIQYLCFDVFADGSVPEPKDFKARIDENPLFVYSAQNWGHHVRQQEVKMDLVL
ncbi:uncharacterized protein N7482_004518 [Penicillium canariense]|uniref:NACHT domain-containing protein n=1 Tax=Penicillium canariense TaxID=189055 RepID=A0A9W9LPG2_9EURO|nr:uncharacterized protein N7482_004518 [Penicillium canariense]KAJ5168924.1 hypothetical protein N7482_004518 [Penicillium canariense]